MTDVTQIYREEVGEIIDADEVNSLVSEIIHTLQDDYGYLKPQPKSTKGNIQGNGINNWDDERFENGDALDVDEIEEVQE